MRRFVLVSFMMLFSAAPVFSQGIEPPGPPSVDKIRNESERIIKENEKIRKEHLDRLKAENPEAVSEAERQFDLGERVSQILNLFRRGEINQAEAINQLYPIIQQQVNSQMKSLDMAIAELEKKLQRLQKERSDPEGLIKKRIDELLGKKASAIEAQTDAYSEDDEEGLN